MELYIDRDALGRALARIQGIIERRSTQLALTHVLLHARDGLLRVTATDTEVAWVGELEANVTTGGEVAVDASSLFQVVRNLDDPTVHLALGDGHRLAVASGRARFRLNGMAAEEFPPLSPFEAQGTLTLAEDDLRRLVEQVAFSVATEDVRWGLNGAHLEARDVDGVQHLRFVATDGHRLSAAEAPFEGSFAFSSRMLVPRKALGVLRKILDGRQGTVSLSFGEGAMQLEREGQTLWFRLLDGEFPDYHAVVPKEHKHAATVRRADLTAVLKRVQILVAQQARPVTFRMGAEEIEVEVRNADRGEVKETLPVEMDGEDTTVGFNARYLLDILGVLRGERVVLELAHPLAPCLVRDPDDPLAFFVVMPMRLD